ncbi:hypothetical protein CDO52_09515 [Nocardiopsis gilva YIM 90087]|uniref:DNA-binding protein n=1 Tax=Nocardiopsis gilva YIM 90087 TaxID=1235441 RepID=A0A223S4E3_9ACTN|nr:hypothetical protein CDO52_09515 [Nocardiopsis gilva YIM 90087]
MNAPQERPHPAPTPLTEPYWSACRTGRLVIQRCAGCRRYVHFPEPACPFCRGTALGFEPVSGRGHVLTYTVIHRPFVPGFADLAPYAVAWVELVEQPGLRAFGGIRGCPTDGITIGMPVAATFTDLPGFGPIPDFRPLGPEERDGRSPATPRATRSCPARAAPDDHGPVEPRRAGVRDVGERPRESTPPPQPEHIRRRATSAAESTPAPRRPP